MSRSYLVIVAIAACMPAPPPAPVVVATPAPERPTASLPPAATPSIDVPRFARVDVDPETANQLRAKIVRAGPHYLSYDAPTATMPGRSVLVPVIVLDGDAHGAPRRPRLLCEDGGARVAFYMDANDLGTVALAGAAILPAPSTSPITPDAPGVHLAAGALIEHLGDTDDLARVRYRGLFLSAEGFVLRDRVDVVYAPDTTPVEPPALDGELLVNVDLRSRPSGPIVARIAKEPRIANELFVQRIGAPVRGFVEIRYDEDDAYAVGWVPQSAVRAIPRDASSSGSMTGVGDGAPSPSVRLTRGTLLADPATGSIVGVVTADAVFACRADCDSARVLVTIEACAGTLELRTR